MNDNIETYIDDEEEPVSCCCAVHIIYSDICSSCKEHCAPMVTCQACKGKGSIYRDEHNDDPCPICDDGFIEV